jgi:hypothetical protein
MLRIFTDTFEKSAVVVVQRLLAHLRNGAGEYVCKGVVCVAVC